MKASRHLPAAAMLIAAGLAVWQLLKVHPEVSWAGRSSAMIKIPAEGPRVPGAASGRAAGPPSPAPHPLTVNTSSPADLPVVSASASEPSSRAPIVRLRFAPAPSAARLPLVFALPPEEMTGLNPQQAAAAIAIADQFYTTLGGDSADPSTTEYKDRWKREQPLADYQLRAAIGAQAYARYQELAYLRAKSGAAQ